MSYRSPYSIPQPHVASKRFSRLAGRVLTRPERLRVQTLAVLFIFLLLTGPVYWIHPPEFNLRQRPGIGAERAGRIAGDAAERLSAAQDGNWLSVHPNAGNDSSALLQVRAMQEAADRRHGEQGDSTALRSLDFLLVALNLRPETRRLDLGRNRVLFESRHRLVQGLRSAAAGGQVSLHTLGVAVDLSHIGTPMLSSPVLLGDEWAGTKDLIPAELKGYARHVTRIKSSCLASRGMRLCCEMAGELEYLLSVFERTRPARGTSVMCVHHGAASTAAPIDDGGGGHDETHAGTGCPGGTFTASVTPILALQAPYLALTSSAPTFVGHADCGPLFVHQSGDTSARVLDGGHFFPDYSYCVNSALLTVLNDMLHPRGARVRKRLRTGCSMLRGRGMSADGMAKLGPVKFASKMLSILGV